MNIAEYFDVRRLAAATCCDCDFWLRLGSHGSVRGRPKLAERPLFDGSNWYTPQPPPNLCQASTVVFSRRAPAWFFRGRGEKCLHSGLGALRNGVGAVRRMLRCVPVGPLAVYMPSADSSEGREVVEAQGLVAGLWGGLGPWDGLMSAGQFCWVPQGTGGLPIQMEPLGSKTFL